jgi:hypothetical protein
VVVNLRDAAPALKARLQNAAFSLPVHDAIHAFDGLVDLGIAGANARRRSNALDALVVVNLRDAAPALKARLQTASLQTTCS